MAHRFGGEHIHRNHQRYHEPTDSEIPFGVQHLPRPSQGDSALDSLPPMEGRGDYATLRLVGVYIGRVDL